MHTIRLVLPFFIFLFLFLTPAFASPTYIDSSYDLGDAYVLEAHTTTNYGTNPSLCLFSSVGGACRTYIKFDVSSLPNDAQIQSANISLYAFGRAGTTTGYVLAYNTSLNWTETNVTWVSNPINSVLQSNTSIAEVAGNWYNFSVKDALNYAINNGDILSIFLRYDDEESASAHGDNYRAKEYTDVNFEPRLYFDYNTSSGCNSHDVNGTWCDEYNLTMPCIWTNNVQPCYDVITENPNPFNSTRNKFTTFTNVTETNCGISHNQCPSNFMCVQYNSPLNHSFLPIVECYNGQTGQAYFYNETGDNSTNPFTPSCNNPTYWNNSWSCAINDCHWCFLSPEVSSSGGFCTANANSCPTTSCYNPSQYTNVSTCSAANCNWCDDKCQSSSCPLTVCSSNYGGQIALQIGGLMGITDCSMSEWVLSMLLSISVGFGVLYYGRDKKIGINGFVVGTLGMLILFTLIGWFPSWVMIIFIVISAYLMAKSMGFGGG